MGSGQITAGQIAAMKDPVRQNIAGNVVAGVMLRNAAARDIAVQSPLGRQCLREER
jgi:hypothetical protein